jgi:hypothetical protein
MTNFAKMTEEEIIKKNPFGKPDGTPIDGKEPEFFAWAREKELERRKTLPKEERESIERSENALDRRMNS